MLNLGSLYCLSTLCGLKAENRETEQQDVCFQDPPKKSQKALMTWLDMSVFHLWQRHCILTNPGSVHVGLTRHSQ